MSKKLNHSLVIGIFLIGIFSVASPSKAATFYWDTTAGAGNGTGGTGNYTTGLATWSTDPLGSATLVANTSTTADISNFQGSAGTVTFGNSLTNNALNINTTGYTFTTATGTARVLKASAVTLGNNVNLNLTSFSTSALRLDGSTITGGTGSSITLVSAGTGKRAVTLDGATVASSAPIIFNITGNLPAGDYLALGNDSGTTTVNSTVTGNSGTNNMTIFSKGTTLALNGAVSGSQGLKIGDVAGSGVTNSARVELNASNSYAGKTTLNGGTVYVSNNSSFSTNSIVVAANTIIRGVGALTNNQILNAVEFGTSGANLNIGSSANDNAISFNGLISGSGSVTAGAKAQANATAMLMGTNNTFTGGVSANNGVTLYVGSIGNKADAQSSIGTGPTITLGSTATNLVGGLRWAKASGNETSDKDFAIAGNAAILANGANNASLTLSGVINSTTATNKTITFAGYNTNTLTINGLINEFAGSTNSVVIGVSSSGTVVLGNTNNSFSGAVSIGQNTTNQSTVLQTAQIGSNGVNSTLGRNGTINIGSSDKDRFTALRYVGEGETSDKVINLSGTTGGAHLEQAGTSGNLKFSSAITATGVGAKSITLKGATAATGELAGNIADGAGSVISLVKNGSGTWILSGSNSYTGTTTVEAKDGGGTLLKLMGANALSTKTSFAGSSALSNIGTVNFGAAGDYTAKSFGNEVTAGNNMAFTNSSGGVVNLTFTNANNVLTLSTGGSGGRNLLNRSANLNIVFDGNMDIGSTNYTTGTGVNQEIGGSGNWLFKGNLTNGAGIRGLDKTGTGTLELRGTGNSYTGTTEVDEGTLNLSGSLTGSTSLIVSTIGTATNATRGKATLNVASGASLLSGSTTTVYSGAALSGR